MNDIAAQTLQGSYRLVEMPDGTMVAMHQLENGKWVTTEERLKRTTTEIMKHFEDTNTIPNPHNPLTVGTLKPKDHVVQMEDYKATKNRLDAYLGEVLGDPVQILANDPICLEKLKMVRARPQELRHVLGLMDVIGPFDARWQEVRKKLMHID